MFTLCSNISIFTIYANLISSSFSVTFTQLTFQHIQLLGKCHTHIIVIENVRFWFRYAFRFQFRYHYIFRYFGFGSNYSFGRSLTHTHEWEKYFFYFIFFFFFIALHHNRLSFFLSFLLISHFVKIFCLQFFFLCNMREAGWLPKFIIIRRLSMFFWLNFFSRKNRSHFQNVKWVFHSKK